MEEQQIFEYELIPGFRANSKLLHIKDEEQIFKYRYSRNDIKYYYCYQRNCKVCVAVDLNNTVYCRKCGRFEDHNHGPQGKLLQQLKVINELKCEVQGAPMKRSSVRDIFDEKCKKLKGSSNTLEYGRMRRQLFNIKQQKFPKSPMTFADIINIFKNDEVVKHFAMSRYGSGDKFYADTIITESFSYTLFVSPTISRAIQSMSMSEPRNYVLHATFNVVPISKEFKQLLIIHFVHDILAFPFVYVLMSNKTEEAYIHMLQYLKSNIFDLQPTKIVTDYEKSLRNAIKNIYPTVQMVGCWFHYTNALRRKASRIPGFITQLNKNNQAKLLFNKFLYLPLLKANDITAAFQILKTDAMDAKYVKGNTSKSYFEHFIKYFETYWMKKEKVTNFSVYNEPIRTSNAAETFHSHLYRKLPKHGNFYGFLEFLCELEATKSIDFLKAISGCTSVYTARKSYGKKRSMFIQNRYQLLREKKITLSTLLAQFSKMKNCMLEEDFINTIDSADDMESDANNSEEEDTDAVMQQEHYLSCIVCCQNERQILFDPCKHFKVCQPCYQQIKGRAEKTGTHTLCPICRAIITDATFIYW